MSPAVVGGDRKITDLRLAVIASETIVKTNQQTKQEIRQKKSRREGGKDGEKERETDKEKTGPETVNERYEDLASLKCSYTDGPIDYLTGQDILELIQEI